MIHNLPVRYVGMDISLSVVCALITNASAETTLYAPHTVNALQSMFYKINMSANVMKGTQAASAMLTAALWQLAAYVRVLNASRMIKFVEITDLVLTTMELGIVSALVPLEYIARPVMKA